MLHNYGAIVFLFVYYKYIVHNCYSAVYFNECM